MKFPFIYCLTFWTLVASGCGGDDAASVVQVNRVMVSYQSQPLADVQVGLRAFESGPVLAQAVSAPDGRASFQSLPDPEPREYCVSLQSLSDGGWILDSRYAHAAKSGIRLMPFSNHDQQIIELPRGAVRPLHPARKK